MNEHFSAEHCLNRARRLEPSLQAWVHLDEASHGDASGPLGGVGFGVKDIIDVRGQPTRFGSAVFEGNGPALTDAPVVAALREAGAVPVGKTQTTEFAFIDPAPTRNPHDLERTPGGSSSGSGAVVGAGIVPFALGTQTAGSLCRPACYCGAAAWKPGLGVLPVTGVAPLSRSFDQPGVIARDAGWLERVYTALAPSFGLAVETYPRRPLSMARLLVPEQQPEDDAVGALRDALEMFSAAGASNETVAAPVSFTDIIEHHRTVMLFEAARDLLPLVEPGRALLSPKLAAALAEGEQIDPARAQASLEWLAMTREAFWLAFTGIDLVVALPVPGAAPRDLSGTGDQSYLTPWTALGGPLVSLTVKRGAHGMPLGVLLAAPPGHDARLIATAGALARLLPGQGGASVDEENGVDLD